MLIIPILCYNDFDFRFFRNIIIKGKLQKMNDKIENPVVLTIDFGTQSLRTSLIDPKGNIVSKIKKHYDPCYVSTQSGYAEQDADFYWEYLVECLTKLAEENKNRLNDIVGATLTSFRDSSVQLDKNNVPVRKCILWLDQRMADAKEKIPFLHNFAFHLVGMQETISLNRKRCVAHWLKENEQESWSRTKKYVNISTYLIYKLTGNLVDSCSSMTGHYPINFKKRVWYKENAMKARIYGIPARMLCELKQPGEVLGVISDEIAERTGLPKGIKLIATGSDKACETVGLGALNRDTAAISYGTASSVEVSNAHYHEPEKFLPAYPAAVPGYYNMEVQVYRGYWMLNWFTREFASELIDEAKLQRLAVEELLNARLAEIPPGSDGLVLQPYWGPGLSRPLSKGAIVGFSDVHTREHLYKAIIEGIAYALREGLEGIEKSQKHKVKQIRISGGGSQSEAICQITADIFNLPVSRVQTFETTSLGAAMSTFLALGYFNSIEEVTEAMSHQSITFYPNAVNNQKYEYLYKNAYLKLYPSLKGIYKDIKTFGKRHG